jgi:hypothetical protein
MENENQKSYQDMNAKELRDGINRVLNPDAAPQTPQADTRTVDELKTAFILAKTTPLSEDEKMHLRNGIISWQAHRND